MHAAKVHAALDALAQQIRAEPGCDDQRATLDFGIASHRFAIDCFRAQATRHEQPDEEWLEHG